MSGDPLPTETEDLLAELAELGSFTIGDRTPRDWPAIESALGVPLPSQYKAYTECFPPGVFRMLVIYHPARSDSPPWPKPWGLVEAVRDVSSMLTPWDESQPARYKAYPEPGGLIPWADYEGDYYLCWLPNDDDADRWPVVAFNSYGEAGSDSEIVEGSTLQALIRVIRGDAGRSVFPRQFYTYPVDFMQAFPENEPGHPDWRVS